MFGYILNYTVSKIMEIISKYKENIDKLKLLVNFFNSHFYKKNQTSGYYEFNFQIIVTNKNYIEELEKILIKTECQNINIYP